MYPDSGYKMTHAQSVCTRPFSRGEGPGDEARFVKPRPPSRAGNANISRVCSPGGGCPVSAGITHLHTSVT